MVSDAQAATGELFDNKTLAKLMIPLIIEQFLAVFMGIMNTIMVSNSGEAAVSGISLVDSVNVLLIQVFAALATGGAIVSAQYIGKKDYKNASVAAKQLLYSVLSLALLFMLTALVFNQAIISAVFGNIETDVMQNAKIYFYLSAVSYPFLALFNSSAALFRIMNNSRVSMLASIIMNVINFLLNLILIYGMGWGVAGAGTSTLVARVVGAVIMLRLVHRGTDMINIDRMFKPEFKLDMIKRIMKIGIPSGLENGMFQLGRLMVARLVSTFGTTAIAANAIVFNAGNFANMPGAAMGIGMITVVGQTMGAGDHEGAKRYIQKIMSWTRILNAAICMLILIFNHQFIGFYNLNAEGAEMARQIMIMYCIVATVFWSDSFTRANALRAAGDVKFTMTVSMLSMWIFRIGLSYAFNSFFGWKLYGVWYAMYIDWVVRAIAFHIRFKRGKWKEAKVI